MNPLDHQLSGPTMNAPLALDFYAVAMLTPALCLTFFTLGFTLGSRLVPTKVLISLAVKDNDATLQSVCESEEEEQDQQQEQEQEQDTQESSEENSQASSQEAPLYLPRTASFRATPALTAESKSPDSPTKHAKGRHEWECVRTILLRGQVLTLTQVAEALIPPLYTGDPVKKSGKIIAPHYLKWSLRMGLIEIVPQE